MLGNKRNGVSHRMNGVRAKNEDFCFLDGTLRLLSIHYLRLRSSKGQPIETMRTYVEILFILACAALAVASNESSTDDPQNWTMNENSTTGNPLTAIQNESAHGNGIHLASIHFFYIESELRCVICNVSHVCRSVSKISMN